MSWMIRRLMQDKHSPEMPGEATVNPCREHRLPPDPSEGRALPRRERLDSGEKL
jgi:hypothetical protein